jgi:hypothetical protein
VRFSKNWKPIGKGGLIGYGSAKLDKTNFEAVAKSQGYKIIPEYKFCFKRKFKADWFIEHNSKKILIEYEGINSYKSRHTSITGYANDCEKYNLAQRLGFIVLRYTALNFQDVFNDIEELTK